MWPFATTLNMYHLHKILDWTKDSQTIDLKCWKFGISILNFLDYKFSRDFEI